MSENMIKSSKKVESGFDMLKVNTIATIAINE